MRAIKPSSLYVRSEHWQRGNDVLLDLFANEQRPVLFLRAETLFGTVA